jgi:hypothetical protein
MKSSDDFFDRMDNLFREIKVPVRGGKMKSFSYKQVVMDVRFAPLVQRYYGDTVNCSIIEQGIMKVVRCK